jgi:3-oxoacyl-[acyl-carrier protein] reductase
VTGANHGIGAAIATALAARGAAVFLTFLRLGHSEQAVDLAFPAAYRQALSAVADSVADAIRDGGGVAECLEADLADSGAPGMLFDRAEARLGPVEILVNNATGWLADTFLHAVPDRFGRTLRRVDAQGHERQFAVDARAPALLISEFARRHIERGATWGRIIGLTSGGPHGFPEEVSYGAAKAAQENYTMSAAAELGRYGVTANMVHPPATDTGWFTPAVEREAVAASPFGQVCQPADIAEVVAFLVSDQARRMTGQVIHVS